MDSVTNWNPVWSPDGKFLYFVSDKNGKQIAFASDCNGIYQIFTVDVDGTNLKQITFADGQGASSPVWSSDGKRMAFTSRSTPYVIDLTKSWQEQTPREIKIGDEKSRFSVWDWSSDGKKLLGAFADDDTRSLGYYSLETNHFEKVLEVSDAIPSWLSDSRHFIYAFDNKIFIADIETKKHEN